MLGYISVSNRFPQSTDATSIRFRTAERLRVFVSYSRSNAQFADELVDGLEFHGGFAITIDRNAIENAATDDLAYMMAMLWYPDRRRLMEQPLLDLYHLALQRHGVTRYDRQALANDYRLSVLWLIARPVMQAANNVPPRVWWNNLERILLAVDDLGCRDLLG
jgi:hypothetical protein